MFCNLGNVFRGRDTCADRYCIKQRRRRCGGYIDLVERRTARQSSCRATRLSIVYADNFGKPDSRSSALQKSCWIISHPSEVARFPGVGVTCLVLRAPCGPWYNIFGKIHVNKAPAAANAFLFHTISVWLSLKSLQSLTLLSEDSGLASYVHTIVSHTMVGVLDSKYSTPWLGTAVSLCVSHRMIMCPCKKS